VIIRLAAGRTTLAAARSSAASRATPDLVMRRRHNHPWTSRPGGALSIRQRCISSGRPRPHCWCGPHPLLRRACTSTVLLPRRATLRLWQRISRVLARPPARTRPLQQGGLGELGFRIGRLASVRSAPRRTAPSVTEQPPRASSPDCCNRTGARASGRPRRRPLSTSDGYGCVLALRRPSHPRPAPAQRCRRPRRAATRASCGRVAEAVRKRTQDRARETTPACLPLGEGSRLPAVADTTPAHRRQKYGVDTTTPRRMWSYQPPAGDRRCRCPRWRSALARSSDHGEFCAAGWGPGGIRARGGAV